MVNAAIEEGRFEAEGGESIAVAFGNALQQAMQTQTAQVVAHAPLADLGLGLSEQLRKQWPQLAITEAFGLEAKQDDC